MVPGGRPVTAVPGLTPRSPAIMVGPVLVTVDAARTAKPCAAPRDGTGDDSTGAVGTGDATGRVTPVGTATPLVSIVTAAVRARARPDTLAP